MTDEYIVTEKTAGIFSVFKVKGITNNIKRLVLIKEFKSFIDANQLALSLNSEKGE